MALFYNRALFLDSLYSVTVVMRINFEHRVEIRVFIQVGVFIG